MIIEKVFYVYPICHIYQLWKNLGEFYDERQFQLDEVLMEFYYKSLRIQASEREELIRDISTYVINGFLNNDKIEFIKQELNKKKNKKFNIYYKYIILFSINCTFCLLS